MEREELVELLRRLGHSSEPVSRQSLKLFSDLDRAQVDALREEWHSLPTKRRTEIVNACHTLADENVDLDFRQVFFLGLRDTDATIRTVALDGLWEDENLSTLRCILSVAQEDLSSKVRAAALLSLSRFAYLAEVGDLPAPESQSLYDALMHLLTDTMQPAEVRRRALESLGYFSDSSEVREEIRRAYEVQNEAMRESALVAMGRSMDPAWFSAIERELRSPLASLRYEAARAVGEFGEEGHDFLPILVTLTEDEDDEVSQAAIWAMGEIGGSHAKRVLSRLARRKNEIHAEAASEALATLAIYDDDF